MLLFQLWTESKQLYRVCCSKKEIWKKQYSSPHSQSQIHWFACALGLCSGERKRVGQNLILFIQAHLLGMLSSDGWCLLSQVLKTGIPLCSFRMLLLSTKGPGAEALLQTWCIIHGPPVTFVTRAWNRLARIHPETVETNGGISWYEGVSKWKWQEDNDKWLKKTLIMARQRKR